MANLKEIRNRITSVSSTQQITSAMKMVSASKLRRAQQAIQQDRARCSVLDNGQTIVGVASLFGNRFPHQSHVGLFDIYTCSQARLHARLLADHCLQMRQELGIQQIYAMCIDPSKRELLLQLGFSSRTVLPDHYRIGQQYHDCELLALNEG